ncbi:MAG: GNAT family N-acetyltransferase [Bacteroidota bacterium]
MDFTLHIAQTEAEREAIYRLRYEVYVEEMHIFNDVADHECRMLYGENDTDAWLMYAKQDGQLIGSLRLNLGKYGQFSDELEETYDLQRFRDTIQDEQLLVLTRFMVRKGYRGSRLSYRMIEEVAEICKREKIEVAVCDCQPHLIRYYQRMGFRSYACPVYNDDAFGIMIPLAFVIRDLAYLADTRSPFRKVLEQPVEDLGFIADVAASLGNASVSSVAELPEEKANWILEQLSTECTDITPHAYCGTKLFESLPAQEVKTIISKGHLLDLKQDDLMIRSGQQTTTVFMILAGEVDICKGGQVVHRAVAGEVIGELGFLLNSRRTADVRVASRHAQVLSFDESRLKQRIKSRTPTAAQLLYNLCQILAARVAPAQKKEKSMFMVAA